MSDRTRRRTRRRGRRNYEYVPRTGKDLLESAPPGTNLFTYSELSKLRLTPLEIFRQIMGQKNIILLQNPDDMYSGHWITLSFKPELKEAYFFSSYGGKPDEEKLEWIPPSKLRKSRQENNFINDGLKQLAQMGWTVYYNDYPYQKEHDDTASCGIWASAFLNSDQNPDEFEETHKPLDYYYNRLFRKKKE